MYLIVSIPDLCLFRYLLHFGWLMSGRSYIADNAVDVYQGNVCSIMVA